MKYLKGIITCSLIYTIFQVLLILIKINISNIYLILFTGLIYIILENRITFLKK